MRPSAIALLVFALLVAGSIGGAAGQTTPTATPGDEPADAGGLSIAIQLEPDGDALWNVSARFTLRSANDSEAFDRLAEDFRNGDRDVGFDVAVFETVASEAATQTGREMHVRNVERSAHAGNDTGILSLSFTWTNFSRASAGRLVVGDVFATGSGTWLPRLTADQTLVIVPPDGYTVQSVGSTRGAQIDNRSLVVRGPATFERGEPSITYVGEATTTTPDDPLDTSLPLLLVLVLSAAIAGVYAWARHQGSDPIDALWTEDDGSEERTERPSEDDDDDEPSAETDEAADEDDEVDVELLSDEERVVRLLEDNGGRMKQATIVKETGWSNAKVSQLLSAMADEGRVNKLRIGRENLISLPDEEFGEFE